MNMNHWLPIHKLIAAFTGGGLLLVLLIYIFGVRHYKNIISDMRDDVSRMEGRLAGAKLPLDEKSLSDILAQEKKTSVKLKKRSEEMYNLYASPYVPKVEDANWKLDAFLRQHPKPARDLYMNEYDRIVRNSPYGNLDISGGRLGLTRDTDSPDRSFLFLQLWGMETLLAVAHECGLELMRMPLEDSAHGLNEREGHRGLRNSSRNDTASNLKRDVPCITLYPPRVYAEEEKNEAVQLDLRFRLGLSGTHGKLVQFIGKLNESGTFFGIGDVELKVLPPGKNRKDTTECLFIECVSVFTMVSVRGGTK